MIETAQKKATPNAMRLAMKRMAGRDTTATGEPDYASMFNRWMRDRVLKVKPELADTLGARKRAKGLLIGDGGEK